MTALIPLFPLLGFLINGSWYALGQAPKIVDAIDGGLHFIYISDFSETLLRICLCSTSAGVALDSFGEWVIPNLLTFLNALGALAVSYIERFHKSWRWCLIRRTRSSVSAHHV